MLYGPTPLFYCIPGTALQECIVGALFEHTLVTPTLILDEKLAQYFGLAQWLSKLYGGRLPGPVQDFVARVRAELAAMRTHPKLCQLYDEDIQIVQDLVDGLRDYCLRQRAERRAAERAAAARGDAEPDDEEGPEVVDVSDASTDTEGRSADEAGDADERCAICGAPGHGALDCLQGRGGGRPDPEPRAPSRSRGRPAPDARRAPDGRDGAAPASPSLPDPELGVPSWRAGATARPAFAAAPLGRAPPAPAPDDMDDPFAGDFLDGVPDDDAPAAAAALVPPLPPSLEPPGAPPAAAGPALKDNGEELEWRVEQCIECIEGTTSLDQLDELEQIKAHLQDEGLPDVAVALRCPLSGALMGTPGKGMSCEHVQPFDLRQFLLHCLITTDSLEGPCPVCGADIPEMDLICSPFFAKVLHVARQRLGAAAERAAVKVCATGEWRLLPAAG